MTGHTPTPWVYQPHRHGWKIWEENHQHKERRGAVADVTISWRTSAEADANAAFIVTACNAHDSLVSELKQVALELEEASKLLHGAMIGGTPMHGTASLYSAAAERVRQALAAAGEKPND